MSGKVVSLAASLTHSFSKAKAESIYLEKGRGVLGDCHNGVTVQHLSRIAVDPTQPNLRQVHLIQSELFAELARDGFNVQPGDLGENVTTNGVDLLDLPRGTILKLGPNVEIQVTGLRNPCVQIENFMSGLLSKVVTKRRDGTLERKTGVMAVVLKSGEISVGESIVVEMPTWPHIPLDRV